MRTTLTLAAAVAVASLVSAQGSITRSGAGCPAPAAFYEQFTGTGSGDLAGQTYHLIYTGNGYSVVPAPGAFDPNFAGNLNSGDDQLHNGLALGFPFPVPGDARGTTTTISASSNGWIGMFDGDFTSSDISESVTQFLNEAARVSMVWDDLNPAAGGAMYFDALPGKAMVTWDQVPQFANTDVNTFQCQFLANGDMIWSWQSGCADDYLAGYSAGGGQADPGSMDLTASVPFLFAASGGLPLTLGSSSIPAVGQTLTLDVTNVPAASPAGVLNIGFSQINLALAGAGAPGCSLLVPLDASLALTVAPPTATAALTVPNNPAFVGGTLEFQGINIAPGANALNVITSNRLSVTLGQAVAGLTVTCQGSNTFNSNTASGFFQVLNNTTADVTHVTFDWVASSNGAQATMGFDTNQTGLADRFDGGNSVASGCLGTYRNGSDVTTGLDYTVSPASPCDPTAATGWVGSNQYSTVVNTWQTLDFAFTGFNPGETFEFDSDTDGGQGIGGDDMAGMVVTVTLSDGRVLTGEVQAAGPDLGVLTL